MNPDQKYTAVVISPLNALMQDQISKWNTKGIPCIAVHDAKSAERATQQHFDIAFTSPEYCLTDCFRTTLLAIANKLCVITFDEVHCIAHWGLSGFRPKYTQAAELLSIITTVPVLLMTATINEKVKNDVLSVLAISDYHTVAANPDRPEIFLDVRTKTNTCLQWLVDELLTYKQKTDKTIIYCRSAEATIKVYDILLEGLEEKMYVKPNSTDASDRLVEQFSSFIDPSTKQRVLTLFSKDSNLRVVVTTVAFGMGIDIEDVRTIVLWGLPENCSEYWQQVGRACRDGKRGRAILYKAQSNLPVSDEIKGVFQHRSSEVCIRWAIISKIHLSSVNVKSSQPTRCNKMCSVCDCAMCLCCCNCRMQCPCYVTDT